MSLWQLTSASIAPINIEERLQEMIEDGTILIDADGEAVGQVNGLSVMSLGDYSFGKSSRITARTYVGQAGVINIERETELGGPIHNKGVMIITIYSVATHDARS